MASDVRERMISGAIELLARRGLQQTSFAEVTQATQTPRGSIYHHFPGGKQELILEALDRDSAMWRDGIRMIPRESPEEFIGDILKYTRIHLLESDLEASSAASAVTLAAENTEQLDRCAEAFSTLFGVTEEGLIEAGVKPEAAHGFARLVMTWITGVTVTCRASRDIADYDAATELIIEGVKALPRTTATPS